MKKLAIAAIAAPTLLYSTLSLASDASETKAVEADVELGWVSTSGNTETSSTKAAIDISHNTENWTHNYVLGAYGSQSEVESSTTVDGVTTTEEEKQTTAEKYNALMKNVYKMNEEHAGLFALTTYDADRFSGYEYQASISLGYTNRLFSTDQSFLDYSVGPGYSVNKIDDDLVEDGAYDKTESAIIKIDLQYEYAFSDNAKFEQSLSSDVAVESDKNTKTKSVSALTAKLNNKLALKAALELTHNSEVVSDDIENLDTQSSITLVYSF